MSALFLLERMAPMTLGELAAAARRTRRVAAEDVPRGPDRGRPARHVLRLAGVCSAGRYRA